MFTRSVAHVSKSRTKRNDSSKKGSRSRERKNSPLSSAFVSNAYYDPFDREVNRAIARELYVDSQVNVVNPSGQTGRLPKNAVKPGQMNLFNPVGIKGLSSSQALQSTYIDPDTSILISPGRQQNIS